MFVVDTPGFMPGVQQEKNGIIKRGGRFLYSVVEADVPKVTITVRKSYGGAYAVMGSKQLTADLNFAWPTARIAVIGADGAAQLLVKRFPDPTAPEVQKIKADFIEGYNLNLATPYIAAERGYIDAVIEPHQTRLQLRSAHAAVAGQADPAGAAQARPDPDLAACRCGRLRLLDSLPCQTTSPGSAWARRSVINASTSATCTPFSLRPIPPGPS